jgi:hypothetical protein
VQETGEKREREREKERGRKEREIERKRQKREIEYTVKTTIELMSWYRVACTLISCNSGF